MPCSRFSRGFLPLRGFGESGSHVPWSFCAALDSCFYAQASHALPHTCPPRHPAEPQVSEARTPAAPTHPHVGSFVSCGLLTFFLAAHRSLELHPRALSEMQAAARPQKHPGRGCPLPGALPTWEPRGLSGEVPGPQKWFQGKLTQRPRTAPSSGQGSPIGRPTGGVPALLPALTRLPPHPGPGGPPGEKQIELAPLPGPTPAALEKGQTKFIN